MIFSRDVSKKISEELKRYNKDHVSCHEMIGWTHDQWPIFKNTLSIIDQRVLGPYFTRDKEASL